MDTGETSTQKHSSLRKPAMTAGTAGTAGTIYKIGDLAREFDVTLRTLRFYEDRGLINPGRSGTTRLYSAEDRERLRVALFCKRIGLSLGDIRLVLELHDHSDGDGRTVGKNQEGLFFTIARPGKAAGRNKNNDRRPSSQDS